MPATPVAIVAVAVVFVAVAGLANNNKASAMFKWNSHIHTQ